MGACACATLAFDEEAEGQGAAPPVPGMDTTNASINTEAIIRRKE